jgi:hypothetical protein
MPKSRDWSLVKIDIWERGIKPLSFPALTGRPHGGDREREYLGSDGRRRAQGGKR